LESLEFPSDGSACRDEVGDNTLINIEVPLVFAEIANLMTLVEDPPDLRTQAQCVGQHLKHDVTLMRPKSRVT